MNVFSDPGPDLAFITEGIGVLDPDLACAVTDVTASTRRMVRSYLGLSVTVFVADQPVTLTVLDRVADGDDVGTTARLRLPVGHPDGRGATVILFAAQPGALVDFAADLCCTLELPLDAIHLDSDLFPPPAHSALTGLAGLSDVNQALGLLIDRGFPPERAAAELQRLARDAGEGVRAAARTLLRTNTAALATRTG